MPPDRVVPPSGFTAQLTVLAAAAMAFLAVFALALGSAAGRLAERWDAELARTATLRISAPPDQIAAQTEAALRVLQTTPGIASARAMTSAEAQALLQPWFGPDLPVALLPIPQLVEITTTDAGFDATGLRARLQGEVPGAVLDDHTRWRAPLIAAAGRLRVFGGLAVALIALSMAAMVTLAAQVALAANERVIRVLRQVGASDRYITRAFVRRFTLRGLAGAAAGTAAGLLAVLFLPGDDAAGGFPTGLGFQGTGWLIPLAVPPFAAAVAWIATRTAARRSLRAMT
ncbi:MAG: cell division protein FtsX [Rubellimicrobium sp.]|nr:cell division protein FtsX [Rubellimicrobium sp.]